MNKAENQALFSENITIWLFALTTAFNPWILTLSILSLVFKDLDPGAYYIAQQLPEAARTPFSILTVSITALHLALVAVYLKSSRWKEKAGTTISILGILGIPIIFKTFGSDAYQYAYIIPTLLLCIIPSIHLYKLSFAFIDRVIAKFWIVPLVIILLLVLFITYRLSANYQFTIYDLGLMVNVFYNAAFNGQMYSTILNRNFFSEHFSPSLWLLVPIYRIFPFAYTLVLIQILFYFGAIWPLRNWLRALNFDDKLIGLIAVIYIFLPFGFSALTYPFHEIVLIPFTLFYFLWLFQSGKTAWSIIPLLITLGWKEDCAIFIIPLLAYLWINNPKNGKVLLWFILFSLVWLITSIGFIIPYLLKLEYSFVQYRYGVLMTNVKPGIVGLFLTVIQNPLFVLKYIYTDIAKHGFVLLTLIGIAPLLTNRFGVFASLLLLPSLLIAVLSNHAAQYYPGVHQYPFYQLAPIVIAIVYAIAKSIAHNASFYDRHKKSLIWLVCFFFILGMDLNAWQLNYLNSEKIDPRLDKLSELTKQVPPTAAVASFNNVVDLANRSVFTEFPDSYAKADFVLLDTWATPRYYFSENAKTRDEFIQMAHEAVGKGFQYKGYQNGYLLLEKPRIQNAALLQKAHNMLSSFHLRASEMNYVGNSLEQDAKSEFNDKVLVVEAKGGNTIAFWGPYLKLEPGEYEFTIKIKGPEGRSDFGLSVSSGNLILSDQQTGINTTMKGYQKLSYKFRIDQAISGVETKLYCKTPGTYYMDVIDINKIN